MVLRSTPAPRNTPMPDMISVYYSESAGTRLRVQDMHPHHARNALAKVLRDPEWAARQFSAPVNHHLHAAAAGFRYVVEVEFPSPRPAQRLPAVAHEGTVTVPYLVPRRADGRRMRQGYRAAGLPSTLYRITAAGVLEKVR